MKEKTVIIVDDSKYIIGLLERFFRDELKFNVVATFNSGIGVIEKYKQYHPDLVTLDLSMPGISGKEILIELMKQDTNANVIIISAIRGDSLMESLLLGAKGFINKPLKFFNNDFKEDFIKTVNEAMSVKKITEQTNPDPT